jgi:[protein-PII] uridylyltransferase
VTDKRDFKLVEDTLRRALKRQTFDFSPLIEKARRQMRLRPPHELEFPTRISIDNKAHPTHTLIQVQTADHVGLLYDLLECFGRSGVAMALSRISTQNGAALDTFYVTDNVTRTKITESSRIKTLQAELQKATLLSKEK